MNKYYVVSSDILPEVLEKVLEAQTLLASGKARRISEAVKEVGISRGTFYKYKDAIFSFEQSDSGRKAIINVILHHQRGALAQTVDVLANSGGNILALNQTIPINGIASLTITLSMDDLQVNIEDLIRELVSLEVVDKAELVAVG